MHCHFCEGPSPSHWWQRPQLSEQHLDSRSTVCVLPNFVTGCLSLTGGRDSMPKQHFDSSCWYVLPLSEGSSTRVVFLSSTLIPDEVCTATLRRAISVSSGGRGSMVELHLDSRCNVCAANFAKGAEFLSCILIPDVMFVLPILVLW